MTTNPQILNFSKHPLLGCSESVQWYVIFTPLHQRIIRYISIFQHFFYPCTVQYSLIVKCENEFGILRFYFLLLQGLILYNFSQNLSGKSLCLAWLSRANNNSTVSCYKTLFYTTSLKICRGKVCVFAAPGKQQFYC